MYSKRLKIDGIFKKIVLVILLFICMFSFYGCEFSWLAGDFPLMSLWNFEGDGNPYSGNNRPLKVTWDGSNWCGNKIVTNSRSALVINGIVTTWLSDKWEKGNPQRHHDGIGDDEHCYPPKVYDCINLGYNEISISIYSAMSYVTYSQGKILYRYCDFRYDTSSILSSLLIAAKPANLSSKFSNWEWNDVEAMVNRKDIRIPLYVGNDHLDGVFNSNSESGPIVLPLDPDWWEGDEINLKVRFGIVRKVESDWISSLLPPVMREVDKLTMDFVEYPITVKYIPDNNCSETPNPPSGSVAPLYPTPNYTEAYNNVLATATAFVQVVQTQVAKLNKTATAEAIKTQQAQATETVVANATATAVEQLTQAVLTSQQATATAIARATDAAIANETATVVAQATATAAVQATETAIANTTKIEGVLFDVNKREITTVLSPAGIVGEVTISMIDSDGMEYIMLLKEQIMAGSHTYIFGEDINWDSIPIDKLITKIRIEWVTSGGNDTKEAISKFIYLGKYEITAYCTEIVRDKVEMISKKIRTSENSCETWKTYSFSRKFYEAVCMNGTAYYEKTSGDASTLVKVGIDWAKCTNVPDGAKYSWLWYMQKYNKEKILVFRMLGEGPVVGACNEQVIAGKTGAVHNGEENPKNPLFSCGLNPRVWIEGFGDVDINDTGYFEHDADGNPYNHIDLYKGSTGCDNWPSPWRHTILYQ